MFEGNLLQFIEPHMAQRFALVLVSFYLWCLFFLLIYSRPTSNRIRGKAGGDKLGVRTHRAELATKLTATVHAVIVSIGSASLVFFRKDSNLYVHELFRPMTWPSFVVYNEDAVAYACISLAYFAADFILCVIQVEEQGVEFVIHALAGMSGCLFCVLYGEGLLYLMLLMLFEVSTPFLHLMWWMTEYGYKKTLLFTLNGVALVIAFTTFRLLIGTAVLFKMMYELHTPPEMYRHGYIMRTVFTLAPFSMIALNSVWGFKMWRGMFKQLGLISGKHKHM